MICLGSGRISFQDGPRPFDGCFNFSGTTVIIRDSLGRFLFGAWKCFMYRGLLQNLVIIFIHQYLNEFSFTTRLGLLRLWPIFLRGLMISRALRSRTVTEGASICFS